MNTLIWICLAGSALCATFVYILFWRRNLWLRYLDAEESFWSRFGLPKGGRGRRFAESRFFAISFAMFAAVFLFLAACCSFEYFHSIRPTLQFMHLADSEERAWKAYQHDSVPVAIHAMTELLNEQKAAEKNWGTAFLGKHIVSMDLMFTHARLAKLYAEAGQTNLSEQHISEALQCDREFTNRDELMDFVSKVDKGAK